MNAVEDDAIAISGLIQRHRIDVARTPSTPVYVHMGALLSDAVLQPGLNYVTVVVPRVRTIMQRYASAGVTTKFLQLLHRETAERVLMWRHAEKPSRLLMLTTALANSDVETVRDLADWLQTNATRLLDLRGIGPKTLDYIRKLAGLDAVPVDRHIKSFAEEAGIDHNDYAHLSAVIFRTAALLDVRAADVDRAVWTYCASRTR
jgi:hypothetical protein